MYKRRSNLIQIVAALAVAAVYLGAMAFILAGAAKRYRLELDSARAAKRPSPMQLGMRAGQMLRRLR